MNPTLGGVQWCAHYKRELFSHTATLQHLRSADTGRAWGKVKRDESWVPFRLLSPQALLISLGDNGFIWSGDPGQTDRSQSEKAVLTQDAAVEDRERLAPNLLQLRTNRQLSCQRETPESRGLNFLSGSINVRLIWREVGKGNSLGLRLRVAG